MMTHAKRTPSNPVPEQAANWIMRLHSDDCTDADRQAFQRWLEQNDTHQVAYQELAAFWEDLGRSRLCETPQLIAARAYLKQARRKRRRFFRQRFAAAAALVLLTLLGPQWWSWLNTTHYQTAKGEQTRIQLSDGSRIDANTDTELSINDSWTTRTVVLTRGEALFTVVHNQQKPFRVIAANGLIQDIGTRFNVYRAGNQVSVTVLEGEVNITAAGGQQPRNLQADQHLSYDGTGQLSPVTGADVNAIVAWQKQQLVFKKQPLSVVLEQLGRYHDVTLQIPDARLQALKVSGVFPSDNLNLALATLAGALPVKIARMSGDRIAIMSKN